MNHSKLQLQVFFHFLSTTSCIGLNHAKKKKKILASQKTLTIIKKSLTDYKQFAEGKTQSEPVAERERSNRIEANI